MARKVNGKWYRRAWAEDNKPDAEREMKRMDIGSPHMKHVLVAEKFTDTSTGAKDVKMFSIYFRPRKFKNTAERVAWNRECENSRKWDREDLRKGKIIQWRLAR